MILAKVNRSYQRYLRDRPAEASLIATATYFATLVVVRLFTTLTRAGSGADINLGGTHIHHVVFGIAAILIAGVLALDDVHRLGRAVLFGIGAALVLDEFALVVFLKDVYWLPQGALSGFALFVGLVALAVNLVRARSYWSTPRSRPEDRSRRNS